MCSHVHGVLVQERALDYLTSCIDQVREFNDILQLVIVELVYKVCHANPTERARFIRCIYNLLNSSSAAVRYEAAGTLVTLSSSPTAIKVRTSSPLLTVNEVSFISLLVAGGCPVLRRAHCQGE